MSTRPEHEAPPEIFYNESQAKKYAQNTRILNIQAKMSKRAIELLTLPIPDGMVFNTVDNDSILQDIPNYDSENTPKKFEPYLVLDIGCGSGITGEILDEIGHYWIGLDISRDMLNVAKERGAVGDMYEHDMGQGVSYRIGVFDAVISISALQWLCNADKKSHNPRKRLADFFKSLYKCMKKGAKAVFQFYPENSKQLEMISNAALKNGFGGGVVVDYPNSTRAKKYFLVLLAGMPNTKVEIPKGKTDADLLEQTSIKMYDKKNTSKSKRERSGKRAAFKSKEWIIQKKVRDIKRGKEVRHHSKYTGRKRKNAF